jgi:hypothetical protein
LKRPGTILLSLAVAAVVVGGGGWFADHFENGVRLISAVSPVITVSLAIFAVHVWRVQLVTKRRFEVAEEALSTSQEVVYALSGIRSVGGWSNEGQTRKRGENETKEESERLDHAFVPFERISHFSELFAKMMKSVVLVEIHFGSTMANHMRILLDARGEIIMAARGMERMSRKDWPTDKDESRMNKYMAVLYEGYGDAIENEKDVLSEKIKAAFAAIEAECRKHLAIPSLKNSLRLWG